MSASLKLITLSILLLFSILYIEHTTFAQTNSPSETPFNLTSPDKSILLTIQSKDNQLIYSVKYKGQPIIEPSPLGLVVNGKTMGDSVRPGSAKQYRINEKYAFRGVHNIAVNYCNGATIDLVTINNDKVFTIDVRAFNNGIAFRYIMDRKDSGIVERENTFYAIPAGSTIWSQSNIKYYEAGYKMQKIEEVQKNQLAGPPLTIQLPGGSYAAITEGGLTDYAGMSLISDGNRGFQANLSGTVRKFGRIESPWRIIEIGNDLNSLVNNDIVANVSPAFDPRLFPEGYNTSWIKPGRSVWSWLAKSRAITLENMKHFSDMAAELGFEYNLVDEGWGDWKDGSRNHWDMMKELVEYSANKGVKIWVWKAYPNRKGIPGIKDSVQRKEFFKKCKELGIVGLKVDFFDSEAQVIVQFYQAALRDAAQYQLMINFHGANKPTGEARTWPNEMTREAIRGLENRGPWAEGNTILPFTRYLAGHADFTPLTFNRMGETTWSHQIASMVIFTSPLLCVGADPQDILDNPFKKLIQSIPSTWDETIVLAPSKIGKLALFARRKGDIWYLAAMNGGTESQQIKVDLSFLGKGNYNVEIVKDDKAIQQNAQAQALHAKSSSQLIIDLNPAGGFVAKFDKLKK